MNVTFGEKALEHYSFFIVFGLKPPIKHILVRVRVLNFKIILSATNENNRSHEMDVYD